MVGGSLSLAADRRRPKAHYRQYSGGRRVCQSSALAFNVAVQTVTSFDQSANFVPVQRRGMHAERNPAKLADVRCQHETWVLEEEFLVLFLHLKTKTPFLFELLKNDKRLF